MNKYIINIFFFIFFQSLVLISSERVEVEPKPGDGIQNLFQNYRLSYSNSSLNLFLKLNKGRMGKDNSLLLKKKYILPIKIYAYNDKSIRSTIKNYDYDYAVKLRDYNNLLFSLGIKSENYLIDKKLYVPEVEFYLEKLQTITAIKEKKLEEYEEELFGQKYKNVKEISHNLSHCAYYIISGHGGPDPGAIGKRKGFELHEDEYAYDVSLRLAKKLMENGAKVFLIVQDSLDGIRDDYFLSNSYNEKYYGNILIDKKQLPRLKKRAEIVNTLYEKNKDNYIEHIAIPIHVDSRENKEKKIDIYFYHSKFNDNGKLLAETLRDKLEEKYNQAQPGRGYEGSVSFRNLYMIRELKPTTIYIELGNIQNYRDQIRIIDPNNRQAIANWLTEGFLKFFSK